MLVASEQGLHKLSDEGFRDKHQRNAINMNTFAFFQIEKDSERKTAVLYLNRPEARNAMSWNFWEELPLAVEALEQDPDVRVVIIAARGKSFSTGLDIAEFFTRFKGVLSGEVAEDREKLRDFILKMQSGMRAIHHGRKVYIAAVHRHCIGGGLDLISACDLRIASKDAKVSLREAKVAIIADMGSLNRLPDIIGIGNTRYMAYTGRDFSAEACYRMGLFQELYENQEDLMRGALSLAEEIAANPALAVRGSKHMINYAEGHTIDDSLDYVATLNAAYLDSRDFRELGNAFLEKRRPNFS